MWLLSRPRSEHDNRFLLNMELGSRINLTTLGEKWFVEVVVGTESHPVAVAGTGEEANAILKRIFDAVAAGDHSLDLAVEDNDGNPSDK